MHLRARRSGRALRPVKGSLPSGLRLQARGPPDIQRPLGLTRSLSAISPLTPAEPQRLALDHKRDRLGSSGYCCSLGPHFHRDRTVRRRQEAPLEGPGMREGLEAEDRTSA